MRVIIKFVLVAIAATLASADFLLNQKVLNYYYAHSPNWMAQYLNNGYKLSVSNLESKQEFVHTGDKNIPGFLEFTTKSSPELEEACDGRITLQLKNSPLEYCLQGVIFIVEPFEHKGESYSTATMVLVYKTFDEVEQTVHVRIPLFKDEPSYSSALVVKCEPIIQDQVTALRKLNSFRINNSCIKAVLSRKVVPDKPVKNFVQHLSVDSNTTVLRTVPVLIPGDTLNKLVRAVEQLQKKIGALVPEEKLYIRSNKQKKFGVLRDDDDFI